MLASSLAAAAVAGAVTVGVPERVGFWDPGFQRAIYRSDYAHPQRGSDGLPITTDPRASMAFPCEQSFTGCVRRPRRFGPSVPWTSNAPVTAPVRFWTLIYNTEPAFAERRAGPPGMSSAVTGNGGDDSVYTVLAAPDPIDGRGHEISLMVKATAGNTEDFEIPYLELGASRSRGNRRWTMQDFGLRLRNQPVARLGERATVRFRARVRERGGIGGVWFRLVALVRAAGGPYMVMLNLLHEHEPEEEDLGNYLWNWPIQESLYHPGARLFIADIEDARRECGLDPGPRLRARRRVALPGREPAVFAVDLTRLFRCPANAWSQMLPEGPLAVERVAWAVELFRTPGDRADYLHMGIADPRVTYRSSAGAR